MELKYVIIAFIGYMSSCEAKILPAFVKTCNRKDPNLSKCWEESMMSLIPRVKDGIPEMGLRPLDPIFLPSLDLDFGGTGSVAFKAKLHDLNLYGCSELTLHDTKVLFTDETVEVYLNMLIPVLFMKSGYKANGQVLLLRFDSTGDFVGNFTNVEVKGQWKSKNFIKRGRIHSTFDNSLVKVKLGSMRMHFDRLLGDNEELNNNINSVINENSDLLYDELRPVIENVIDEVIKDSVNKVYNLFPKDVLYPK